MYVRTVRLLGTIPVDNVGIDSEYQTTNLLSSAYLPGASPLGSEQRQSIAGVAGRAAPERRGNLQRHQPDFRVRSRRAVFASLHL